MRTVVPIVLTWALLGATHLARAYEEDPAVSGITVGGRVIFSTVVPKPERVLVHRDSKFCGETVAIESLRVDPVSHAVEDVVISLEGIEKGKPAVPEKAVISFENRTCRFIPRVMATVAESTLEIRNSDPILHNTHIRHDNRSGPTVINVVQPAGTTVIRRPLRVTGLLDIRCDAHPFMRAAIHVFEHPYFSVTDNTGRFEITQVPPGTYKLRIWHHALGDRAKTIVVPSVGSLTLTLELAPEE